MEAKAGRIKQDCNKFRWFVSCPPFIKNIVFGWHPAFLRAHAKIRLFQNLKYSPVGFELFWKNSAESEQSGGTPLFTDAIGLVSFSRRPQISPSENGPSPEAIQNELLSPASFALIWNLDKKSDKGGVGVITGSRANHKEGSPQAVAAVAKKRRAASGENRTQTRAHCDHYL